MKSGDMVHIIDRKTGYMTAQEAADKWGITVRQVQSLCKQNRIKDAVMLSRIWIILENAEKPTVTRNRNVD